MRKFKILSIPRFNEETLEFEVDESMPKAEDFFWIYQVIENNLKILII